MKKYNLNEHPKSKKVFKVLGPLFLIIALGLITTSIVDFFIAFDSPEMRGPTLMYLFPLSFPFFFSGAILTSLGYQSAMMRYQASQVAPVAKDFTNYMLDNTKDSVAQMVSEIQSTGKPMLKAVAPKPCLFCKEVPNADATFCDNCGKPLVKVCSKCQSKNDQDAFFCQQCGQRL